MEITNPETLDEDAVVSGPCQAQNPFYRTQEEAIDLTSKSFGDFNSYCTGRGVSNVELLNRYIDKEKGIVFVDFNTEESQIKVVENVDVLVPKEGSKVDQNAEVVVEKSAAEGSGNGISLFVEVFGPPNGLVVDKPAVLAEQVSRSSNHLCKGNGALLPDNKENPSAKVSDLHYPILGVLQNGTIDCNTKGLNEAEEECKFVIDDLVWVKTKAQSWWPGLIFDPLCAPKHATKSDQSASLFVKYFGNISYVWCSPSQLMPFVDSFKEMSAQGNSTSFNGAVKKAVNEFSRRVKSQMTCSCILKEENQTTVNALSDGDSGSKDLEMEIKMCRIGVDSVNLFEPENFVANVKFLALDISMPGMLEFEATRNCLYAFYRALGHRQLPMNQLRVTTDVKDSAAEDGVKRSGDSMNRVSAKKVEDMGKVSEVEMDTGLAKCTSDFSEEGNENSEVRNRTAELAGVDNCQLASPAGTENKVSTTANDRWSGGKSRRLYESRERRRSRYLLPPYTDLSFGTKNLPISEETETGGKIVNKFAGQSVVSSSLVKSSGDKLQKKKSAKAISERDASGIPCGINLSSENMLSELRFAALDCLNSNENGRSDEVEIFFCGFRRFVFLGKSDGEIDLNILQTIPGVEFPMDKARAMVGDSTEYGEKNLFSLSLGKNKQERSKELPKFTYKRRRKKEMVSTGPNTIPVLGFSDVNGNPANGSSVINFQETGGFEPEAMPVPKKRRKEAAINVELQQAKVADVLPDLNGSCTTPGSLVEDSQENISFAHKLESKTRKNSDETASAKTHICGVVDANNAKVGPLLKDVQVMCPCSTQDTAELHKEGMKKDSATLNSNSKSEFTANQTEANVNNVYQSKSFVKDLLGLLSPVGKPCPKKRKRKDKAPIDPIPDLNGNAADPISPRDNLPAGKFKTPHKRRRNKPIAGFTPEININYNKMQTYGEASGSVLLLKFAQGFPLPSKEALIATFCGFGRIKESETQTLGDSVSAQVVFENSSDARNALKSLEKSSPFGPVLITSRLQHLSAASKVLVTSKTMEGFKIPSKKPCGLKPISEETPNLSVMRKNLEMMTLMLEKAGHDISPETRFKLETEVKGLLKKVSTMVGSSSTTQFKL